MPKRVHPLEHPLIYSIDVFIPFVDLHQEDYWEPNPKNKTDRIYRY